MLTSVMTTRQQLTQTIEELPGEMLPELANFLNYLCFKSQLGKMPAMPVTSAQDNFLLAIAGLGSEDDLCNLVQTSETTWEQLRQTMSPFAPSQLESPDAPSVYQGKPLSLEDMDRVIHIEAGKRQ